MRRRVLQGGLAACSLFLPAPWAWVRAQSAGAAKLLRAPKVALVVGNAAYRSVPALRNPGNDSAAIAQALRASGFEVTLAQDATRREMLDAIDAYAKTLAARKSVGLFYFAGHGVQLQWQNYLLPVDAKVGTAARGRCAMRRRHAPDGRHPAGGQPDERDHPGCLPRQSRSGAMFGPSRRACRRWTRRRPRFSPTPRRPATRPTTARAPTGCTPRTCCAR